MSPSSFSSKHNEELPPEQMPGDAQWHRLYELAQAIHKLAPWKWLSEMDIFGVQHPETGQIGYVSVMGALGEHVAIAVYLGEESLLRFLTLTHIMSAQPTPPDRDTLTYLVLENHHLQLEFCNRNDLPKHERERIRRLGFKFRGRHAWPAFHSYRPGYAAWDVDAQEADFLILVLEQALEVLPRIRENRDLLRRQEGTQEQILVRTPTFTPEGVRWRDAYRPLPQDLHLQFQIEIPQDLLDQARQLPQARASIAADLRLLPFPIGKSGERPQMAYMLMFADLRTQAILHSDLLTVETTVEDMWGQMVPTHFLAMLLRLGARPQKVQVQSTRMATTLAPLAHQLDIELEKKQQIPTLEYIFQEMYAFMSRR